MVFKDRKGSNLNRKKIKIISQTSDEIIADIVRADNATEDGTLINASVFNTFQSEIDAANSKSSSAESTASSAVSTAVSASGTATSALESANNANLKADTAVQTASSANAKADIALNATANGMGTVISIKQAEGEAVAMAAITFSSDPQTQFDNILSLVYPVGSIYMSTAAVNPTILFGGEWTAWGGGRVPVGIGSNGETNYLAAEQIGGSENSFAAHTHTQDAHTHTQGAHSHTDSGHQHGATYINVNRASGSSTKFACPDQSNGSWSTNSASAKLSSATVTNANTIAINNTNGEVGGNRQPFITCYMWKRIA